MRMKLFLLMIIAILPNTLLAQTLGFDEESLRGLNDDKKIEYIKNLHKMIEKLQKDILQLRSDIDKYENDEKKELNNKIKLLQNDLKELHKNIISKLEKENDDLKGNLDICKLGQDSLIMIFTDSIVNIKQYYIYCLDTLIKQNKNFIDSIYKLEWLTTANKVQIENM
ncbi:MAG: hypothetical protein V1779_05630, partial [bacterium]